MVPLLYMYIMTITALGSYFLGLFVLFRNPKHVLYRAWFYFCFSVGTWSLGYSVTMFPDVTKEIALVFSRISHSSGAFMPFLFLRYVLIWLHIDDGKKFLMRICCLLSLILATASLTPLVVVDLVPKLFFKYYPTGRTIYGFYVMNFVSWVILAHYYMIKAYKISSGYSRNQMKYVLTGTMLGYFGGATCFPLIFNIPISPYPAVLISIYLITTSYAIFKYGLMDIRVAITRAGIFAFVYALVLGITFLIIKIAKPYLVGAFSDRWWLVILGIGMVLAGTGPFIYMRLKSHAEAILLREERKRHQDLAHVSQNILRFTNLDALLKAITHSLIKIMQIKLAAIYLVDEDKKVYSLKSAWQPPIKTPDLPKEISFDSALIKTLNVKKNKALNLDEIRFHYQRHNVTGILEVKQTFESLRAHLVIPAYRAGKLVGFLSLGDKRSERGYSYDDIEVLMVLANHVTLAIENAIFSGQERERQAILFHSASLASLGTMASMMGHQVNNRFQAVNNLAGFSETLELMLDSKKDFSLDERKQLIEKSITSLRRISDEATKGGETVASIRRLGKLSSEEFTPVALGEVLDVALGVLRYKIKFDEFDFNMEVPDTLPKILGDSTQLGEVFFNLIDNAYDAIKERVEANDNLDYKLEGDGLATDSQSRKPQLTVKAYIKRNDKHLHIEVSDTGMGIKDDFMPKLFVPFYTTKTSSGKGTGLGLHVIKRIIEFHKGKISVESKYGEGTTFKIELPTAEAREGEKTNA
ncbi:MAG TPA: GAF domain-containing protein [Candidatus Omnitrophica bacterium]|nr:GAF domain-containing protein [Candidatus Omnitrophota bacterium]